MHQRSTDLYIIAAGNGSRLGGNVPKALVPITDEPCLTTNLKQIGHKFERIFVIVNKLVMDQWTEYRNSLQATHPSLLSNVFFVPISSGYGDGHAVTWGFDAVLKLKDPRLDNFPQGQAFNTFNNDVVIMWGDVFIQHAELFDELLAKPLDGVGIVPAVYEDNPYVTLLVTDDMQCVSANFSKYGEKFDSGYHDQSVFRFDRRVIWTALSSLDAAYWKNGKYITPGGELSLLHTFHYLNNCGNPVKVYETAYPTLSFNTLDEVASIQMEINAKWKNQHQFS